MQIKPREIGRFIFAMLLISSSLIVNSMVNTNDKAKSDDSNQNFIAELHQKLEKSIPEIQFFKLQNKRSADIIFTTDNQHSEIEIMEMLDQELNNYTYKIGVFEKDLNDFVQYTEKNNINDYQINIDNYRKFLYTKKKESHLLRNILIFRHEFNTSITDGENKEQSVSRFFSLFDADFESLSKSNISEFAIDFIHTYFSIIPLDIANTDLRRSIEQWGSVFYLSEKVVFLPAPSPIP